MENGKFFKKIFSYDFFFTDYKGKFKTKQKIKVKEPILGLLSPNCGRLVVFFMVIKAVLFIGVLQS